MTEKEKTLGQLEREYRESSLDRVAIDYRDRNKLSLRKLKAAERAAIRKMFASAMRRVGGVDGDRYVLRRSVVIAAEGPGAIVVKHAAALELLKELCWPLTISAGVCAPSNPAYSLWQEVRDWARSQDLLANLKELDLSPRVGKEYRLEVIPSL